MVLVHHAPSLNNTITIITITTSLVTRQQQYQPHTQPQAQTQTGPKTRNSLRRCRRSRGYLRLQDPPIPRRINPPITVAVVVPSAAILIISSNPKTTTATTINNNRAPPNPLRSPLQTLHSTRQNRRTRHLRRHETVKLEPVAESRHISVD